MPLPEIKVMKLAELKAAPYNPRQISEEALKGLKHSLRRYGVVQPVVWNKQTGNIVGGHQRVLALQQEGVDEVNVVVVDIPEIEEKALNVTLNNKLIEGEFTSGLGDVLGEIAQGLPEAFEALKLDDLFKKMSGLFNETPEIEEDAAPAVPEVPVTKPGDLWVLGTHRLLCGDSTASTDVERLMGGEKADMIFTDPPYGVDFVGAKYNPRAKAWEGIANDKKQGESLYDFSMAWCANLLAFAKEASPFYVWTASMQEGYEILKALKDGGMHVQSQLVWVKNTLVLGQADYQWKHEIAWYGWTPGKHHYWAGGRDLTTVWEEKKDANASYAHPMQKPLALAVRGLQSSCPPNGIVIDLFAGSGSTLMACEKMARRCYCIELEPKFCDVIIKRWENATGKKAELCVPESSAV